jgi:hypothetical protein
MGADSIVDRSGAGPRRWFRADGPLGDGSLDQYAVGMTGPEGNQFDTS